jgi:hypothetical protein
MSFIIAEKSWVLAIVLIPYLRVPGDAPVGSWQDIPAVDPNMHAAPQHFK